jgi:hypothetical protein
MFLILPFTWKIEFFFQKKANFMMKSMKYENKKYTIRFFSSSRIYWYVFLKHSNLSSIFFLIKRKKNSWQNFFLFLILPLQMFSVPNYGICMWKYGSIKDKLVGATCDSIKVSTILYHLKALLKGYMLI